MSPMASSRIGSHAACASSNSLAVGGVLLEDDHPALAVAAELRVGHVDAVVAHALGEVEHRLLAILR